MDKTWFSEGLPPEDTPCIIIPKGWLRGKGCGKPAAPPLIMDMGESGAVSRTIVKEE